MNDDIDQLESSSTGDFPSEEVGAAPKQTRQDDAAYDILTEIEDEIRSFAKLPAEFELWLKAKIAKAKSHL